MADAGETAEAAPKKPARRRPARSRTAAASTEAETVQDTPAAQGAEEEAPKKPTRRRTTRKTSAEAAPQADATTAPVTEEKAEPLVQPIVIEDSPPATRRRTGWWKR